MRQQISGWRFLVGLMASTVFTAALIEMPVNAAEEEVTSVEEPELIQTEPPQPPTPPAKPARVNLATRRSGFLFFNPKSPRGAVSSVSGSSSRGKAESNTVSPKVAWQKDFKTAHKQAVASKKPLLVVIGAPWCPSCRKLDREVLTRPEIVEQIQRGFVPVHLNADQNEPLTELLEVESIPAVLILDADLEVLKRVDGYQSARDLSIALKSGTSRVQNIRPASLEESAAEDR